MTKIHQIIGSFRSRMAQAGLINLRTRGSFQPSERLASLRPSITQVRLGLTENPERFKTTQPETPMAILFYVFKTF